LRFPAKFLLCEWSEVVDAWQVRSWDAYRDVARLGRKTRIGGKQREALWSLFEHVLAELAKRNAVTSADVFGRLAAHLETSAPLFDFVIVDEAQDVSVPELRFLAALAKGRPDGLFFAGDLGQRIFQPPFSWKSLGVDIRGRSHTLKINYRTSHQIRSQADRLLPPSITDVDGNAENRKATISIFNGPSPRIETFDSEASEITAVSGWLMDMIEDGLSPDEIGIFVRSEAQLQRAMAATKEAGLDVVELTDKAEPAPGKISVTTMHIAKGLEFRAVVVMACDDEIVPLQERIENVVDDSDLEEAYNTERHLLYVACTRARDHLLVSGVEPASEFLADFMGA
jgi:superfamily I DNA/RNA helicase